MATRKNAKGRRDGGTYFGLPHALMDHQNYLRLSAKAVKLLNDIGRQYNGFNNGDLCATFKLMKKRGWVSKSTLCDALEELIHYGMIVLSRQGGRHMPSLYALTWQPIDECKGKLDIKATIVAPGIWKNDYDIYIPRRIIKKNRCPNNRDKTDRQSGQ
jgi:hypothetical protein